ncbi:MAG: dihydroorotate dehydrogenase electron transfer subunit [Lacipirellulaceae bacterium]
MNAPRTVSPTEGPLALAASCYADRGLHIRAAILANDPIARDTRLLRIDCPAIARRITPGQFVMVRVAGLNDPLLGRAFALYDVQRDLSGEPVALDVVYLVKGKLTTELARRAPGDEVEVWGPLGNGFTRDAIDGAFPQRAQPTVDRLILVAGGIGQTPMLALGKEALGAATYGDGAQRSPLRAKSVALLYGVRTAGLAAGTNDFRAAGLELTLVSDDGSTGRQGLVTAPLIEELDRAANEGASVVVACCGPEQMMAATAAICAERAVPCLVSLETPMACGIGACFSCVAPMKADADEAGDTWDYKRTCVEGPVFDATRIEWPAM